MPVASRGRGRSSPCRRALGPRRLARTTPSARGRRSPTSSLWAHCLRGSARSFAASGRTPAPSLTSPTSATLTSPSWTPYTALVPGSRARSATIKDTGLRKLPFRGFDHNAIWLELGLIAHDLTSWTQALLLTGEWRVASPSGFVIASSTLPHAWPSPADARSFACRPRGLGLHSSLPPLRGSKRCRRHRAKTNRCFLMTAVSPSVLRCARTAMPTPASILSCEIERRGSSYGAQHRNSHPSRHLILSFRGLLHDRE